MSSRLDSAVSIAMGGAALLVAGSIVWRTFIGVPTTGYPILPSTAMESLSSQDWAEARRLGRRVFGSAADPVVVLEFTDFECPACRIFDDELQEALRIAGEGVQVTVVHFPLKMHRFAMQAAKAFECSWIQDPNAEIGKTFFTHQDSIGILSWGRLAQRAGIADTGKVSECAKDPSPSAHIDESIALAKRLKVSATPTVYVDGQHLGVPSSAELVAAIQRLRQARID